MHCIQSGSGKLVIICETDKRCDIHIVQKLFGKKPKTLRYT